MEQTMVTSASDQIFDVYNDIKARTGGDIYIGVVGPVRTGKSTFIKRFMDLLVIPNIADIHNKERAIDELPQSADGKTIMTTEPKFIPKEAAEIILGEDTKVNIRLIDCVGYMVEGAAGHIENEEERMVKTPWYEEEVPFTQAAEIGTKKVINDHSTIGIVVTTDGSFGDLPRENYIEPEERTVSELKSIGKPFLLLLNTSKPYSDQTIALSNDLSNKYETTVIPVNCEQLKKEDINNIMINILSVFPVSEIDFYLPKWAEILPDSHWLKVDLIQSIKEILSSIYLMQDVKNENFIANSEYVDKFKIDRIHMENGKVRVNVVFDDTYYYKVLSELIGVQIEDEYEFVHTLKDLAGKKKEYELVSDAWNQVRTKGYGVVTPIREDITIDSPEVMKHSGKYGVKLKANAPSVHMIKANIVTEIAPIVGSQEQAEGLREYILENAQENEDGIWEANIYGKTVGELIAEGIQTKVNRLSDDSQLKLQETMQKIINDSNGGIICIII